MGRLLPIEIFFHIANLVGRMKTTPYALFHDLVIPLFLRYNQFALGCIRLSREKKSAIHFLLPVNFAE
jgi:pyruvate-formate lyase